MIHHPTISNADIANLRNEAVLALDWVQAALCDVALDGFTTPPRRSALKGAGHRGIRQTGARKLCFAAIEAARASA